MLFITDKNLPEGKFSLQCWGKVELESNMRSNGQNKMKSDFRKRVLWCLFGCSFFPPVTMLPFDFSTSDFRRILTLEQEKFLCGFFDAVMIFSVAIDQLTNAKRPQVYSAEGSFCSLYLLYNDYDPGVIVTAESPFEDHINLVI